MKWKETGEKFNLPVFSKGRPELVQVGFDHQDANALMTLFTIRMLKQGFLASSAFNPTLAHQIHHVDDYFSAAGIVFEEIHESLEKQDVFKRIRCVEEKFITTSPTDAFAYKNRDESKNTKESETQRELVGTFFGCHFKLHYLFF